MLEVIILTPEEALFEGKAKRVIFPGEAGVFEAQSFHRSLVSRLLPGVIYVDDQPIPVERGVVKIEDDVVTVLLEPQLAPSGA